MNILTTVLPNGEEVKLTQEQITGYEAFYEMIDNPNKNISPAFL